MTIRRSKYGNRKIKTEDGLTFDSKKEMNRYYVLKKMEAGGEICNLQRQVKYKLLSKIEEEVPVQLKTKVGTKKVTLFRETYYIADFVYNTPDGEEVIEDVKASQKFQDPIYKLKKKLMYMIHHIKIKEIY